MTRKEKELIVSYLTEEFKTSDAVIICNYKGLNVSKMEILRNMAKEADVKVQVAKNTLVNIAMQNAGFANMNLKDTNVFVWGMDQLAVTKVVAKFSEKFDIFEIKNAYMDNEIASVEKVIALSKMPSRDELVAMLLQVWNAPITNFTIGLNALKEKKESA